jgi:hypothetical protein
VNYYLDSEPDSTTGIFLKFLEPDGSLIKEFSNRSDENTLDPQKGFNQFSWDMRYPDAEKFEGMILWAANLRGPVALPGTYQVRLVVDEDSLETSFSIIRDPRSDTPDKDLKVQFDFIRQVNRKISDTHEAIKKIRKVRNQVNQIKDKIGEKEPYQSIQFLADTLNHTLTTLEEQLYQTKNKSNQDPLNFPIRLNNKLAHLMWLSSVGDYQPTDQAVRFKEETFGEIDGILDKLQLILEEDIDKFNQAVLETGIMPVLID